MAGTSSEESGVGKPFQGVLTGQQRCQSEEALAEWRSSEQGKNGIPLTSPPYWDTDDDDDCGLKPSELYGKFTWKIDNFSTINKRTLRSNQFEVGGYKWYILIYPQGCDVCNHLSLFLCVANHDKLLPGWSHFAQFTISIVNEDPKKSKHSDTLHRFWKKEHDWGWKKFMDLSESDRFIDANTLIIRAQVQVISNWLGVGNSQDALSGVMKNESLMLSLREDMIFKKVLDDLLLTKLRSLIILCVGVGEGPQTLQPEYLPKPYASVSPSNLLCSC